MARDALEGTDGNGNILHSDKNSPGTTKDALDTGVPMARGPEHQGPEDAAEKTTRGDYSKRTGGATSYTSEPIPANEQTPGGPTSRLVKQFSQE